MHPEELAAARALVAEIAAAKQRQRSDDLSAALTIISQRIYAEETHFLLELIQNAEDAEAREIAFVVRDDGIVASNDGRPFEAADVRAITSVGKSTKATSDAYIGFFGIGFKSVFKVSDAPRIYSGAFRFAFDRTAFADDPAAPWQITPLWVEEPPPAEAVHPTAFVLPFAPRLDRAAVGRIAAQFDELEPRLLLFLRRLRRITVDNQVTGRRLAVERRDEAQGLIRLRHGRQTQRWRVFRRKVAVPPDVRADPVTREFERDAVHTREVVIAFGVDSQGNLVPTDDDRLFVFLPTEQRTGLRFLVQGDFLLTAQRDRVQADALWNRWLAREVTALVLEAVGICREHPRWRTQFYELMPLPGEVGDPFFRAHVERPLLAACRTQPVGLAADGTWRRPTQLALAEEPVRALLDDADLGELFERGLHYAAPDLGPRAPVWLGAVGTRALPTDALLQVVGQRAWLEQKARSAGAAWFARLYQTLHFLLFERYERQGRRYDYLDARAALSEAAFVYTAEGTVEVPQRVFFPLTALDPAVAAAVQALVGFASDVHFVHPRALETSTPRAAYRLLADCGVRYANPREVVERWLLPLYEGDRWLELAPPARDAIVRLLFAWWAGEELEIAGRLAERLGALRLRTSDGTWERVDQLYLGAAYRPGEPLAEVMRGVPYASADYLGTATDRTADAADWAAFLRALGAADWPRVRTLTVDVPGPPPADAPWWDAYIREALLPPRRGRLHTAMVDGLAATLATGDAARLERLAQLLAMRWESDYAQAAQATWASTGQPAGPAAFVYLLRREPWLPTTLGLRPPVEAYRPPAHPDDLLADLLPVATSRAIHTGPPALWVEALGVRSSDTVPSLVAALAAVPRRLDDAPARARVFALYDRLLAAENGPASSAMDGSALSLLGEDGAFHPAAHLYVRDDERVYASFRARAPFAATPPGQPPGRYAALLRALGARSAAAHWRAEVLVDEAALPCPGDDDEAGLAAAIRAALATRWRYVASLAAHVGRPAPVADRLPIVVVPRLVVRERLDAAEVLRERHAFCVGSGAPVYVQAGASPAWLELAEALAAHLAWPRNAIVPLRLTLTEPEDELGLLFRLLDIALLNVTPTS